jgi:peroxiredoxin
MRADIVAGAVFPDYELTDHTGRHRKLSDLQGPDPMILVLSRGGFCPKDRRQADGLVQLHHEMEVGYSRLVTISTDNMLLTNEYRSGVGAHWTFLSDPARKVSKGSRYCRIHGPRARSDDPARYRPRTWSRHIQDLQRLLVFWPPDGRRAPAGPTSRYEEMPPGLGHRQARTESRLGARRT